MCLVEEYRPENWMVWGSNTLAYLVSLGLILMPINCEAYRKETLLIFAPKICSAPQQGLLHR